MQPDGLTLIMRELMVLVPAVGLLVTVLAVKRLGRRRAWLCGTACVILVVTRIFALLGAMGVFSPSFAADSLFGKALRYGLEVLPVLDLIGVALLLAACLGRDRTDTESAVVERDAPARASLLRRVVTVPAWVIAAAVVVVGGGAALLAAIPTDDAVPRLVQGTAQLVDSTDNKSFTFVQDGQGDSSRVYALNSSVWIDRGGAQRNDGAPACLQRDAMHKVELAFVDVTGSRSLGAGDFPYLLSIRCLD